MNLNKAIRDDIAQKLTAQAVKKHAPAMGKAALNLSKLWRDLVTRAVIEWAPELPQESWQKLIQSRTVNSISQIQVVKTRLVMAGTKNERLEVNRDEVANTDRAFIGNEKQRKPQRERSLEVTDALKQTWGQFFTHADQATGHYGHDVSWKTSFPDIPTAMFLREIDTRHLAEDFPITKDNRDAVAWSRAAWPVVEKTQDLIDKYFRVYDEAVEFHAMVSELLLGCRTAAQVEDRFPEAAKYLPKEVQKRNEVVPTELFEKARRMLAEGIPN